MPTISRSYLLEITASSGAVGDVVRVKNRRTGEVLTNVKNKIIKLDSGKNAIVELANLESGWNNGDTVQVRITGTVKSGSATHTIDQTKGMGKIAVTVNTNPAGWLNTI